MKRNTLTHPDERAFFLTTIYDGTMGAEWHIDGLTNSVSSMPYLAKSRGLFPGWHRGIHSYCLAAKWYNQVAHLALQKNNSITIREQEEIGSVCNSTSRGLCIL